jgi:hypothetical protein
VSYVREGSAYIADPTPAGSVDGKEDAWTGHDLSTLRIDTSAADTLRAMESCASQGAAQGGVYAFPARGMAGAYLPAADLAGWLRSPTERAFADALVVARAEAASERLVSLILRARSAARSHCDH